MTSEDKSNKRGYHHGDLRVALLHEARRVVQDKGHDKLSLRGCARSAGVDVAAVYRHFPNKTMLLATVAAVAFDEMARRMANAIDEATQGGDAVAGFLACGAAYIAFGESNPHLYRLMFGGACTVDQISEARQKHLAHTGAVEAPYTYKLMTQVLDQLVTARHITPDARAGAEFPTWALVHGAVSLRIDGRGQAPSTAELAAQIGQTALRGLGCVID